MTLSRADWVVVLSLAAAILLFGVGIVVGAFAIGGQP